MNQRKPYQRVLSALLAFVLTFTTIFTDFEFSVFDAYAQKVVNSSAKPAKWGKNIDQTLVDIIAGEIGKEYGDQIWESTKNPEKYDCSGLIYWTLRNAGFNKETLPMGPGGTRFGGTTGLGIHDSFTYFAVNGYTERNGVKTYLKYKNEVVPVLVCSTLAEYEKAINDPAKYGGYCITLAEPVGYLDAMNKNLLKKGTIVCSTYNHTAMVAGEIKNSLNQTDEIIYQTLAGQEMYETIVKGNMLKRLPVYQCNFTYDHKNNKSAEQQWDEYLKNTGYKRANGTGTYTDGVSRFIQTGWDATQEKKVGVDYARMNVSSLASGIKTIKIESANGAGVLANNQTMAGDSQAPSGESLVRLIYMKGEVDQYYAKLGLVKTNVSNTKLDGATYALTGSQGIASAIASGAINAGAGVTTNYDINEITAGAHNIEIKPSSSGNTQSPVISLGSNQTATLYLAEKVATSGYARDTGYYEINIKGTTNTNGVGTVITSAVWHPTSTTKENIAVNSTNAEKPTFTTGSAAAVPVVTVREKQYAGMLSMIKYSGHNDSDKTRAEGAIYAMTSKESDAQNWAKAASGSVSEATALAAGAYVATSSATAAATFKNSANQTYFISDSKNPVMYVVELKAPGTADKDFAYYKLTFDLENAKVGTAGAAAAAKNAKLGSMQKIAYENGAFITPSTVEDFENVSLSGPVGTFNDGISEYYVALTLTKKDKISGSYVGGAIYALVANNNGTVPIDKIAEAAEAAQKEADATEVADAKNDVALQVFNEKMADYSDSIMGFFNTSGSGNRAYLKVYDPSLGVTSGVPLSSTSNTLHLSGKDRQMYRLVEIYSPMNYKRDNKVYGFQMIANPDSNGNYATATTSYSTTAKLTTMFASSQAATEEAKRGTFWAYDPVTGQTLTNYQNGYSGQVAVQLNGGLVTSQDLTIEFDIEGNDYPKELYGYFGLYKFRASNGSNLSAKFDIGTSYNAATGVNGIVEGYTTVSGGAAFANETLGSRTYTTATGAYAYLNVTNATDGSGSFNSVGTWYRKDGLVKTYYVQENKAYAESNSLDWDSRIWQVDVHGGETMDESYQTWTLVAKDGVAVTGGESYSTPINKDGYTKDTNGNAVSYTNATHTYSPSVDAITDIKGIGNFLITSGSSFVAHFEIPNTKILYGAFGLKKEDVNGNAISGLKFDLYTSEECAESTIVKDEAGNTVSIVTDANGYGFVDVSRITADGMAAGPWLEINGKSKNLYVRENKASAESLGLVYNDEVTKVYIKGIENGTPYTSNTSYDFTGNTVSAKVVSPAEKAVTLNTLTFTTAVSGKNVTVKAYGFTKVNEREKTYQDVEKVWASSTTSIEKPAKVTATLQSSTDGVTWINVTKDVNDKAIAASVVLNDSNKWYYKWENLAKYVKNTNTAYQYRVIETAIGDITVSATITGTKAAGYIITYSKDGNSTDLINTPEKTEFSTIKVWDCKAADVPAYISAKLQYSTDGTTWNDATSSFTDYPSIVLKADGAYTADGKTRIATTTSTNNGIRFGSYKWTNLPKYTSNNTAIKYRVRETAIAGTVVSTANVAENFAVTYSDGTDATTITNTRYYYGFAVYKANATNGPVAGVQIGVYSDAACTKQFIAPITTGTDGYAYYLDGISDNNSNITVYLKELGLDKDGYITINGVKYKGDTSVHTLTIKKVKAANAPTATSVKADSAVGLYFGALEKFVNREVVDFEVTKAWEGELTTSVKATLQYNNAGVWTTATAAMLGSQPATVTLTAQSPSYKWTDLPKYDANGKAYSYRARETAIGNTNISATVSGTKAEGFVITYADEASKTGITNKEVLNGIFGVRKLDSTGKTVEGIGFDIYTNAAATASASTKTIYTNASGLAYINVSEMADGSIASGTWVYNKTDASKNTKVYYVRENEASVNDYNAKNSKNLIYNPTIYKVEITGKDSAANSVVKVTNLSTGSEIATDKTTTGTIYTYYSETNEEKLFGGFGVYKVDGHNNKVANLSFDIFTDAACTKPASTASIVTNANGYATLNVSTMADATTPAGSWTTTGTTTKTKTFYIRENSASATKLNLKADTRVIRVVVEGSKSSTSSTATFYNGTTKLDTDTVTIDGITYAYFVQVNEHIYSYAFVMQKTNGKGELIPGAAFTVYSDKACTTKIGSIKISNGGDVKATDETVLPNGYGYFATTGKTNVNKTVYVKEDDPDGDNVVTIGGHTYRVNFTQPIEVTMKPQIGIIDTAKLLQNSNQTYFTPLEIKASNMDLVSFDVKKEWSQDANETTPEIDVRLERKTAADTTWTTVDTVTLNSTKGWTYSWDELDKYDSNGKEYSYRAIETRIGNKSQVVTVSGTKAAGYVVTYSAVTFNTTTDTYSETITNETYYYGLAVYKVNGADKALAGAQIGIYTDANATTPLKDASGKAIVLTTGADGYAYYTAGKTDDSKSFTLYLKEENLDKDGYVTINGVKYEGDKSIYSVGVNPKTSAPTKATLVTSATSVYYNKLNTVKNMEMVKHEVEKKFANNYSASVVTGVEVSLKKTVDGVTTDTGLTATLNSSNSWKVTFADLDKYENGKLITYSAVETKIISPLPAILVSMMYKTPSYQQLEISVDTTKTEITNEANVKQYTGKKEFTGNGTITKDEYTEMVGSVDLTLVIKGTTTPVTKDAHGNAITNPVTVNRDNNWTYTWTSLAYSNDNGECFYDVIESDVYDTNGNKIAKDTYSVTTDVNGNTTTVINKPAFDKIEAEIGVYKTDDSERAVSGVKFNVYSDAKLTNLLASKETALNADGKALASFDVKTELLKLTDWYSENLNGSDNSSKVFYIQENKTSVEALGYEWEDAVYKVTVEGAVKKADATVTVVKIDDGAESDVDVEKDGNVFAFTQVNRKVVTISASKVFKSEDGTDADAEIVKNATTSVSIDVYADGVKFDSAVLNKANGWKYEKSGLNYYKEGTDERAVYTIKETAVTFDYLGETLVLDTDEEIAKYFEVSYGSDSVNIYSMYVSNELKRQKVNGRVGVLKIDDAKNIVTGLTFEISLKPDMSNALTGVTGDDGYVYFEGDSLGNWYATAPDMSDSRNRTFYIRENEQSAKALNLVYNPTIYEVVVKGAEAAADAELVSLKANNSDYDYHKTTNNAFCFIQTNTKTGYADVTKQFASKFAEDRTTHIYATLYRQEADGSLTAVTKDAEGKDIVGTVDLKQMPNYHYQWTNLNFYNGTEKAVYVARETAVVIKDAAGNEVTYNTADLIDSHMKKQEVDDTANCSTVITNDVEQLYGSLGIYKLDSDGNPTKATFNVYTDEALTSLLTTVTTDETTGQAAIFLSDFYSGWSVVDETTTRTFYIVETENDESMVKYPYTIKAVVTPSVKAGDLSAEEIKAEEAKATVEFTTLALSAEGEALAKENGFSAKLTTVSPTTSGYKAASYVEIDNIIRETPVSKIDMTTAEEIAGATLAVYKADKDGNIVDTTPVDTWVSGSEGKDENGKLKVHVIKGLSDGFYLLVETSAPTDHGFTTANDILFEIEDAAVKQAQEMADDHTELVINKIELGSKKDDETVTEVVGATLQLIDKDGKVVIEWVTGDITNASVKIDEVYAANGLKAKQQYNSEIKATDIIIEYIPIGQYTLKETNPALGYVTAADITITVADAKGIHVLVESTMEDDVTKTSFEKVDATSDKPVVGAKLAIYAADAEGKPTGEALYAWTTDGSAHVIEMIPIGKYVLVEQTAPTEQGYVKSENVPFEIIDTPDMQYVTMKDKFTVLDITKTDFVNGKDVDGAILQLIDKDGKVYVEWKVGDTTNPLVKVDAETGRTYLELDHIPVGTYTLREITAPDGYLTAEDVIVEVKESAEIQKADMIDYRVPEAKTTATDKLTEDKIVACGQNIKLVDVVNYKYLIPDGREYTLTGTVMVKETGESLKNADGTPVMATTTFKATSKVDGQVTLEFNIEDTTILEGKTLVVYEVITHKTADGQTTVVDVRHEDINDVDQTLTVMKVRTTAADITTGDHTGNSTKNTVVVDQVEVKNTQIGKTYEIVAVLMNKTTGEPMKDADGNVITVTKNIIATKKDFVETVEIEVDGTLLKGEKTIVFESVYYEGILVGLHASLEDNNQEVDYPSIKTQAFDKTTGTHVGNATQVTTVVDIVTLTSLVKGDTYRLDTALMNRKTGEPMLDADGNAITASKTFTYTGQETEKIEITVDGSLLAGHNTIVFETLYHNNVIVALHTELTDNEEQEIDFPDVNTTAADITTKDHVGNSSKDTVVSDTVVMHGLRKDVTYKLVATLMNKETGEPLLDKDGKVITAELVFKGKSEKVQTEIVEIAVSGELLKGKETVVFENLYENDILVGLHASLEDTDQEVDFPDIRTEALDLSTNGHVGNAGNITTIRDIIYLEKLIIGQTYTLKAELMNRETSEALKDADGNVITASKTFKYNGQKSEYIDIKVDGRLLEGTHTIFFETLYHNDVAVVIANSLIDVDEEIDFPEIKTTALDKINETHELTVAENIEVKDIVLATGLRIGKKYVIKGVLMDKATEQPLLDETGNEIVAVLEFVAEAEDQTVELVYTLNTEIIQGKHIVVFENCYTEGGKLVYVHADINDKNQEVVVPHMALVEVNKNDEDGNAVEGVKYQIIRKDNGELIEEITTDENGYAVSKKFAADEIDENLELQVIEYIIKESYAPIPLVLDENEYTFTFVDTEDEVVMLEELRVEFVDKIQRGKIAVLKKGLLPIGVRKLETVFGIDINKLVIEYCFLEGAEFTVYSDDELTTEVTKIVTKADGVAESEYLKVGKYYIKETFAPYGFAVDENVYEVEITGEDGGALYVIDVTKDIEDRLLSTKLTITKTGKVSADSEESKPLSGVYFGVFAAEDIYNIQGEMVVDADTCIAVLKTNKDGIATITENLPAGKYYYRELKTANDSYILDDTRYEFEVNYEFAEDVNIEKYSVNYVKKPSVGSFTIRKQDQYGNILTGAEFTITNLDTGKIYNITIGDDGYASLDNLPTGYYDEKDIFHYYRYTYQETKPANDVLFNGKVVTPIMDSSVVLFDFSHSDRYEENISYISRVHTNQVLGIEDISMMLGVSSLLMAIFMLIMAKRQKKKI